jgi:hypothetical protein
LLGIGNVESYHPAGDVGRNGILLYPR